MAILNILKEGDPTLLFEMTHEIHLMFMYILKGVSIGGAFFGIKANGKSLYNTNIIYGTLLIKIGQSNMTVFLVNFQRRNRCWYLLDQCQLALCIFFVGSIDQIFQGGSPKTS